jgi:cell fate regulator YaaT (PSP1 superfamily)
MPLVCGVRFRGVGKVYHFAPGDEHDLQVEDHVVVETARGVELGQVAQAVQEIDGKDLVGELKPVVRRATTTDLLDAELYRSKEDEAADTCRSHVARMGLAMKIVSAEYAFDGSRLTFFFTSEERVDFRDLVRELARHFRTRIELRQIGVRDEARIVGGLGKCGRPLCCKTWLSDFSPVSIRMAKQQDLPLSPMEISGQCGRLLCCLGYENDFYKDVKGKFPKVGKRIDTPIGEGKVVKISVLRETVTILFDDGSTVDMTADQVAGREPLDEAPARPGTLTAAQESALDATMRPTPSPGRGRDGQAEETAQRPRPRGRRAGAEAQGGGSARDGAPREAPARDDGRDAGAEGDDQDAARSRRRRPRSRRRSPRAEGESGDQDRDAGRADAGRADGARADSHPPARDETGGAPEGRKPSRRRSRPRRRRPPEGTSGDA